MCLVIVKEVLGIFYIHKTSIENRWLKFNKLWPELLNICYIQVFIFRKNNVGNFTNVKNYFFFLQSMCFCNPLSF